MPGTDAQADVSKLAGVRSELEGLRSKALHNRDVEAHEARQADDDSLLGRYHSEMATYFEGQATAYELAIMAIDYA